MTADYKTLRDTPVPVSATLMPSVRGYRQHPIDTSSPHYTEGVVELREIGIKGINHYHTPPNPPYNLCADGAVPQLWLRETVARKLLDVNATLHPMGLELWVFDGWRPLEVQNYFHDVWMPAFLREERPDLGGDALWAEVEKYWSRGGDPKNIDPASPPPHFTGAAVDLTLRAIGGDNLYMGSIFDDVTERAHTDYFEHHIIARSFSDYEARNNRRLLRHIMTRHGFNNLPSEWWHFSWGDQMWAKMTGAPAAHYGPWQPS